MRLLALAALALALAAPADYLQAHQAPDGGFAEPSGAPSADLTAWAALALVAARRPTGEALAYLRAHEAEVTSPPTRALLALAMAALGDPEAARSLPVRAGQTNTVVWTILARRQARLSAPPLLVRALLARQTAAGGWGWARGVAPDSNDTAAAVQALRASGVTGAPVRRALAYLRALQAPGGGFPLVPRREPDAQSTAWAIQAFFAAGERPPARAVAFLQSLRREDGSFRYSRRYAVTPVWVTAQVLPALAGTPFPLRRDTPPADLRLQG